jgi:hypothetical protein
MVNLQILDSNVPYNFTKLLSKFIERLSPLLNQAATNLDSKHEHRENTKENNTLFIH